MICSRNPTLKFSCNWVILMLQASWFVTASKVTLPQPSLKIMGPPTPVPQGATATLTCQTVGTPPPVIAGWLKNGIHIQSGGRLRERRNSHFQILQIWGIRREDEGLYQCKATQGTQNLTASLNVRVLVPPVLHNVSNSTTAVAGSNLTLHCFGTNLLFIRWRLNNSYIDYLPRYKVLEMGSQLVMANVNKTDSGQYTCIAYNQKFQTISTINVTIQYIPEILIEPQDTVMAISHFVAFQCVSDAVPTAAVQWKHDGQLIVEDDRVHVDKATSRLEIKQVLKTDKGRYQCVLANTVGTASSRCAELEVLDVISEAPIQTLVSAVYGQSVWLTCNTSFQASGKIQWTLNGVVVASAGAEHQTSIGQLELHWVSYEREANHYVCLYHDSTKSSVYMQDFQLVVNKPPEAVSSIKVATLNQGDRTGTIRVSWKNGTLLNSSNPVMIFVVKVVSVSSKDGIRSIIVSAEENSTVIYGLEVNGSYYLNIETVTPQMVYPSKPIRFRVQANGESHSHVTATPSHTNPEGTFIFAGGNNERHGNKEQEDKDSQLSAGVIAGIVSAVTVVVVVLVSLVVYIAWNYKRRGSWSVTSDHLQIY